MFKLAEESLKKNPNLQKVIILKSLPRYDPASTDINSIKNKLNQIGNTFYDTLWMQSGCPSNILIADQKLDCQGPLRRKRFGIPGQVGRDGKPWDGIHMRGVVAAQHYTNSLVRILSDISPQFSRQSAAEFHRSCPQAIYQSRARSNQDRYQPCRLTTNENAEFHRSCPQAIYQSRARISQNRSQARWQATNENSGDMQMHKSDTASYTYSDAVKSSQYENKSQAQSYHYKYAVPTYNSFDHLN